MSRAFVNEDDQRETPFVPPRADLPNGVPNYVTPNGMAALLNEKEELQQELKQLLAGDELDKQNAINVVNIKLQMLDSRITSAQLIQADDHATAKVHFGSIVSLKIGDQSATQKFQIVGVDEADLRKGKIAFTSPLAKLLINKYAGDSVSLKLAQGERVFKIIEIA